MDESPNDSATTTFSGRLRQLRRERDMSQKELANLVSLHHSHISRYERGAAQPTADVIRRLARALEASVEYLLEGSDRALRVRLEDQQLLHQFQEIEKLPAEDKQVVKTLLEAILIRRKVQDLAVS